MLTSRNAVYLSGDFRITRYDTDGTTDDHNTQKLIPVIRYGWGALIAYTGVASAPPVITDTGNWILAQMDEITARGSFSEIQKRLLNANKWLSKLRGSHPLAFSVVGFVERQPFMMLISNFSDLDGNIFRPSRDLKVFQRKPKLAEVRVAGDVNAVLKEERHLLELLLQRNTDRQIIRTTLADINAKASKRTTSISQECVTGYLLPSGALELGPHGISDQESYLPSFVIRDLVKNGIIGFEHKYDEHGKPLPPRWIGMTARIQGNPNNDATVILLHVIRNVGEPIGDGIKRKEQTTLWKIAGPNEPRSYTITFNETPNDTDFP